MPLVNLATKLDMLYKTNNYFQLLLTIILGIDIEQIFSAIGFKALDKRSGFRKVNELYA